MCQGSSSRPAACRVGPNVPTGTLASFTISRTRGFRPLPTATQLRLVARPAGSKVPYRSRSVTEVPVRAAKRYVVVTDCTQTGDAKRAPDVLGFQQAPLPAFPGGLMSAAPTNRTGTVPTGGPPGELAGGVLGLPSVLFCIVTGAAPLAAMLFNVPVATLGGGYASPAAFLVATIALTIFSVGYIAMARRVTSAGGFYTFVSRGLGRVAVLGVTAYFASTTVASITGIDLPAWVYMIIGLVLVSLFAWFHIELTAKVLGVLLIGEVLVLVIMAVGFFAKGGAEGFSAAPLNPAN